MKKIVSALFVLVFVSGCVNTASEQENKPLTCTLSRCDCKCHPEGESREDGEGVLCGLNCEEISGFVSCKIVDGACTEVTDKKGQ